MEKSEIARSTEDVELSKCFRSHYNSGVLYGVMIGITLVVAFYSIVRMAHPGTAVR